MAEIIRISDIGSLLAEWDYDLNGDVRPEDVSLHSNKKYYWRCGNGHPPYQTTAAKRAIGHGCPVCSNHKVMQGVNDFMSENPDLMEEWDWAANDANSFKPDAISSGSGSKAHWKCRKCGGSWEASIVNRAKKHSGCPYCANLKVLKGYNDLETVRPELAREWNYEKNGDLKPDAIVAYSAKKVWWRCEDCGNSWEASPNARSHRGCPNCCNHVKIKGFNDFESQHPELIGEWDFEKNKSIMPSQFASGSEKRVWWKCAKGHSWMAAINSRVNGGGCPYCANKKVLAGYNDFLTLYPELQCEWDYEKNAGCDPERYTAGSTKKFWWKCHDCGFSWTTSIFMRTKGYGCPKCGAEKNKVNRLKTYAKKNPLLTSTQN